MSMTLALLNRHHCAYSAKGVAADNLTHLDFLKGSFIIDYRMHMLRSAISLYFFYFNIV